MYVLTALFMSTDWIRSGSGSTVWGQIRAREHSLRSHQGQGVQSRVRSVSGSTVWGQIRDSECSLRSDQVQGVCLG